MLYQHLANSTNPNTSLPLPEEIKALASPTPVPDLRQLAITAEEPNHQIEELPMAVNLSKEHNFSITYMQSYGYENIT